jgi:hypothetical protein
VRLRYGQGACGADRGFKLGVLGRPTLLDGVDPERRVHVAHLDVSPAPSVHAFASASRRRAL